jgi:hypothetical protein
MRWLSNTYQLASHICRTIWWTTYLFLAEFAGNNQISDTTILTPFFVNLSYHPRYDFEMDIHMDTLEEREAQTAAER